MITISKAYDFDAAHTLWDDALDADLNVQLFGKCSRLHGHTYRLEVEVTGVPEQQTGMILNYFDLDKVVKPIVEDLDHRFLNDKFNTLTTAENMVFRLGAQINLELSHAYGARVKLRKVTLQETPKTKAVWHNESL